MAVTRTPTALADGYLPTSKGTLYTGPASSKVYVSEIWLHNINAAAQTVILYVNRTGTSRIIGYSSNLAQNYQMVRGPGLILEAGDLIEGQTTTGSAVHYVISGVVEA